MEEWKTGIMEEWNSGMMEECNDVKNRWDVGCRM
jgi:hypothetical protein